ncbi:MAG: glycan-binding surface protein [Bacteroidota bacterium]|jgi:hypothetical protein
MKFARPLICLCVLAGFSSCEVAKLAQVQMKPIALYDVMPAADTNAIMGFKAVSIYANTLDNSVWSSPEKQCVNLSKENKIVFEGTEALHVKWDKITGGCNWIGIGFGWNNWQAKDFSEIVDLASIQMKVRSVKGSFKNFPVAFAIEDYTNVQTYYGFNASLASGVFTDTAWTTVTIPLSKFPFKAKDADVSKVKQLIIQLEADGDIYLDAIKIVKNEN